MKKTNSTHIDAIEKVIDLLSGDLTYDRRAEAKSLLKDLVETKDKKSPQSPFPPQSFFLPPSDVSKDDITGLLQKSRGLGICFEYVPGDGGAWIVRKVRSYAEEEMGKEKKNLRQLDSE